MKTYPHQENGEIIELVRKDEHDAVVRELKKHLEDANRGAERNAHINQNLAGKVNVWQSLAESLATAHKEIANEIIWPDTMRMRSIEAITAYESAKSGNLPDPLAEAVKRMEKVSVDAFYSDYLKCKLSGLDALKALYARLISAAKGEQP